MTKIHLQTIARLQRQVTELEEELECAMNLKKRLAKLQEQFDAAVKLCYHWEKKCFEARRETQGVTHDDGTLSWQAARIKVLEAALIASEQDYEKLLKKWAVKIC